MLIKRRVALIGHTCVGLLWFFANGLPAAAGEVEDYLARGQMDLAVDFMLVEAKQAPDDVAVQEKFVDVLLMTGNVDFATRVSSERVKQSPSDPDAHYLLGRSVLDLKESQKHYERALRLDPDHARAHMGMGAVHVSKGDLEASRRAYSRALKLDSSLGEAWVGLLRAQRGLKDTAAAIQTSRDAIQALPQEPEAYLTLSELRPEESQRVLRSAVDAGVVDVRVFVSLSQDYLVSGKLEDAKTFVEQAIALQPDHVQARQVRMYLNELRDGRISSVGLSQVLSQRALEDTESKQAVLEKLTVEFPRSALVRLDLADLFSRLEQPVAEVSVLESAYRSNPDNEEVLGVLGMLYLKRGAPERAIPLMQRASKRLPWDMSLVRGLARAYEQSGRADDAVELFEEHLDTEDLQVVADHVNLLHRLGRFEDGFNRVEPVFRRTGDMGLALMVVTLAAETKRLDFAGRILEELGKQTGEAKLLELAQKAYERAKQDREAASQ